jgi:flagellar biosynthetic protein FliS
MFSSPGFSKANTYRQVGAHSGVENASPHQLIQMLFDGLFQSLNAARGAIERGEVEEKGRHITKSVRILQEGLVMGLDLEKGGELAANLRLLYDYSVAQLTKGAGLERNWTHSQPTGLTGVAVQENRLLNYYKAIEAKSAEMLAAAMQQNWDCMVECEKSCSVLIGELRMQSQEVQLTAAQRKEKTRIMQSILRNDAQIRMLAEPWLATLEYMGKMPTTSALH